MTIQHQVDTTAEDLRVLAGLLRLLTGRSQAQMAAACGIHYSCISRYESGASPLERETLARLVQSAGLPEWSIEGFFLPMLAVTRRLAGGKPSLRSDDREWFVAALRGALPSAPAMAGLAEFMIECSDDADPALPVLSNGEPTDIWNALDATGAGWVRWQPSDEGYWRSFEDLALQLCKGSAWEAARDAARALALARKAVEVAKIAPGEVAWRHRLEGYCWAFVGNALRVAYDLMASETCFATAWRLWRTGSPPPGSQLVEWRLQDLEASLRRDLRQFDAALSLLDSALRSAPAESRGRILLKRSFTLEQAGEVTAALAALSQAAPLIDPADEPRHYWILRNNLLVLLCHLNRFEEAESELPGVVELAETLGNARDRIRVRWVSARVAAGLGRREEALRALEEVRKDFADGHDAYNAALVALELAAFYLEERRTAEVQALAKEMLAIFSAQGIHREALATLALFCQAVEADAATADLARAALQDLRRSDNQERVFPFE